MAIGTLQTDFGRFEFSTKVYFMEQYGTGHYQSCDACRLKEGSLLLMELEGLNPYPSLDIVNKENRSFFL